MSPRAFALLAVLLQGCAGLSSSAPTRTLPADFREALADVPPDVQSLMATLEPFRVPPLKSERKSPIPFADAARAMFFATLAADDTATFFAPLEGASVRWALAAKRRQDVLNVAGSSLIALGVHPYEGVAVVRFAEPLPVQFTRRLATDLDAVTTPSGMQAFRSKPRERQDGKVAQTAPWAVMLPAPDTLVLVTMLSVDDAMLHDVAARVGKRPGVDAFTDTGAPWSQVRLESTIWAFGRTDPRDRAARSIGQEWMVFSHDGQAPQVGVFRSVLKGEPTAEGRQRLAQMTHEAKQADLGFVTRGTTGPGFIEMRLECLPGAENRCLLLPFILWARGIMVWI